MLFIYCSIWTASRIPPIRIVGTRYPLALTSGNASVSRNAYNWRAHLWALESGGSSVSDAGLLSVSNSFFDCTTSPDKLEAEKLLHAEPEASETTPAKKSMRFNHFMDFFTTESNYVGILDTILNVGLGIR
ncbi:hypothetical protein M5D96_006817 [Drosophila gunungcola]|uniref:DH domain-containing protein n=1 Tax=Drosophila gunungcola TaxID=103775 RepID=A0A9P9YQQ0_9MUSC|nr:hypothetical protein M5D96_006817 [Drosophila gunungcola]